jgi:hypothetical protein
VANSVLWMRQPSVTSAVMRSSGLIFKERAVGAVAVRSKAVTYHLIRAVSVPQSQRSWSAIDNNNSAVRGTLTQRLAAVVPVPLRLQH